MGREIPNHVRRAILEGDREALSRFGKKGNKTRKEHEEALKDYKERLRIFGSYQMSREAHEDIAPLT